MKIKSLILMLFIVLFVSYSYAATITIEAEDYDTGGEGVAYHDTTIENTGDCNGTGYREDEGVDICPNDPNEGCHVGHTKVGEWTTYTYDFSIAGEYEIVLYVASTLENSNGILYLDGEEDYPFDVPQTDTWYNFTPVSIPINISKGTHTLKIAQGDITFTFDKLEIIEPNEPIDPLDTSDIRVSWDAYVDSDEYSKPEGYRIFSRGESGSYDYDSPMPAVNFPDGNITEGNSGDVSIYAPRGQITTKYFVVRAYNGNSNSPDSDEASITIDKSEVIELQAPTGLTLMEVQ